MISASQQVHNYTENTKMSTNFGSKLSWLVFAAFAITVLVAPAAQATPINYEFTVNATGPGTGTYVGIFSYDSSSIRPGAQVHGGTLLTALDFTFYWQSGNDISTKHYDLTNTSSQYVGFNAAGDLASFQFGTLCENCAWGFGASNNWMLTDTNFIYSVVPPKGQSIAKRYPGTVTWALVPPVSVPEPGTLGLFGLGALLIGLFVGVRRRMC